MQINVSKSPQHPKTFKKITDALDGDAKNVADDDAYDSPNTSDYDAGYTDSKTYPYPLRNRNRDPVLLMMMPPPPMMLTPPTLP